MSARGTAWRLVCGGMFGQGDAKRDDVVALLSSPSLDWPEVIRLADTHFVSPAFWLGLRAQGLTRSLPEDARQYFEALYEMNVERNAKIVAQLEEAVDALNRRGVSPMLLKGAAYLMLGIHRDPGARVVCDLDLLIPREQIETARAILKGIGYFPTRDRDRPGHHHLAPLARDGSPAAIELHRDALIPWAEKFAPTWLVWQKGVFQDGGRCSVPCATHAVLHRFVHDQIVDRHAAQFVISLRSVQDLAALLAYHGAEIDWPWLADRARRFGCAKELGNYLYAASRVAGIRVPGTPAATPRQRLNFYVCAAAEHSHALSSAIAMVERFSAHRIERQHGGERSLTASRLRLAARMIRAGLRAVV